MESPAYESAEETDLEDILDKRPDPDREFLGTPRDYFRYEDC